MTDPEFEAVVQGITDAVMSNVRRELSTVFSRLDGFEKLVPIVGPVGPQGLPGERGQAGERGERGIDGAIGPQGLQGERGIDGAPGAIGPHGENGKDADMAVVLSAVESAVTKAVAAIPVPVDGKDGKDATVDPFVLETLVETRVARAVAALPTPKDGQDGTSVTVDEIAPIIAAEVQKAVAALPPAEPGKDGASFDPAVVDVMVAGHVTKAIAAIPIPKDGANGQDGRSVSVEDVAPLIASEVSKAVSAIPPARDGVGVVGTLIDRDGHLIVTLSDGATKDVGVVVGKDVDRDEVNRFISDELAKWPRPKDGADGLGFDDMEPVYDEHGRLFLRFSRGDIVKMIRVPCIVDRKKYEEGAEYLKGDGLSFANSFWIAQQDTKAKPADVESGAWRLAARQGRPGKDGRPGEKGKDGADGRSGRDLTNLGPDGSKWGN